MDYAIYLIIILTKSSANYNYFVHFDARNLHKVPGTTEPCSMYSQSVHRVREERNQHKRALVSLYDFPTNKRSSFL